MPLIEAIGAVLTLNQIPLDLFLCISNNVKILFDAFQEILEDL